MKSRQLLFWFSILISQFASALPDLSEPNDIVKIENNAVEITNTGDNTILECNVIGSKLQGCKTSSVGGLIEPYRAVVTDSLVGIPRVFFTRKNSSEIYWSPISVYSGKIPAGSVATLVTPSPFDAAGGSILDIQSSKQSFSSVNPLLQRFYFSKTPANSNSHYGQFGSLVLNLSYINNITVNSWFVSSYAHFPAFFLESSQDNGASEPVASIGHIGTRATPMAVYGPVLGSALSINGQYSNYGMEGGATVGSDVSSIAKINDKYWVTYKGNKKFTRFDSFPIGEKVDEDNYHAPAASNVTLRKIVTASHLKSITDYFAVFADDNKIGNCAGSDDFICMDAFRYLDVTLSLNNSNDVPTSSVTLDSFGDHGTLIFHNLNYSPLNTTEVTNQFHIPISLTAAFSGTCLDKTDFTAKEDDDEAGNDTCTLNFDFRNLNNLQPINESFDVGFAVTGAFDPVETTFHFNIDLPEAISNLRFTKNGEPLSQLELNAGDSGTIDVEYTNNSGISKQPNIQFLKGNLADDNFRRYFTDSGCLAPEVPVLQGGEHCTLTYHIPVGTGDNSYTLNLNNSDDVPDSLNVLYINVSARGHVIPVFSSSNSNLAANEVRKIYLQPWHLARLKLVNIGSAIAHNVIATISQPENYPPIHFVGSCTEQINLNVNKGLCNLTMQADGSAKTGRYQLHITGDDITPYDIPITIGGFPDNKSLLVEDSNTGNWGTIKLSQTAKGYLNITNYTGYSISNLDINIPELTLTSPELHINKVIFYENSEDQSSCIKGSETHYHASLDKYESCHLYYQVQPSVSVSPQNATIQFQYLNENGAMQTETQSLYFDNQSAIQLRFKGESESIDAIQLDASRPVANVVLTNNQDYTITDLNLNIANDNVMQTVTGNTCTGTLEAGKSCSITFTLDDQHTLFGNYELLISASNLIARKVLLTIQQAPLDNVQIRNRGGYSMFVDYKGFYPNKAANDSHCSAGSCYAGAETGWFTNPFNTDINAIQGSRLKLNMVAGTSVTLPSCDGGVIVCTGTTLNPYCRYEGDGTDNQSSQQNQCMENNQ
ncbi:hypothetical protein D5018_08770 [Parashewanella curva]|uniref:Uncharacterized protein n=1 Tax=Parashewanella curva TaxID=2338552 RepID=A0A3L8PXP4_9GAMM|nr:hypothetical protein [Parashewanella curva]RLV60101.1 hypothetical protein D5018_08770 [Parashewanella curva]